MFGAEIEIRRQADAVVHDPQDDQTVARRTNLNPDCPAPAVWKCVLEGIRHELAQG